MKDSLSNSSFQRGISAGKEAHENNVRMGEEAIEVGYNASNHPGMTVESLIKFLVATCTEQEQIDTVLKNAGLEKVKVQIIAFESWRYAKFALGLCMANQGLLTRDGMPCMIV